MVLIAFSTRPIFFVESASLWITSVASFALRSASRDSVPDIRQRSRTSFSDASISSIDLATPDTREPTCSRLALTSTMIWRISPASTDIVSTFSDACSALDAMVVTLDDNRSTDDDTTSIAASFTESRMSLISSPSDRLSATTFSAMQWVSRDDSFNFSLMSTNSLTQARRPRDSMLTVRMVLRRLCVMLLTWAPIWPTSSRCLPPPRTRAVRLPCAMTSMAPRTRRSGAVTIRCSRSPTSVMKHATAIAMTLNDSVVARAMSARTPAREVVSFTTPRACCAPPWHS